MKMILFFLVTLFGISGNVKAQLLPQVPVPAKFSEIAKSPFAFQRTDGRTIAFGINNGKLIFGELLGENIISQKVISIKDDYELINISHTVQVDDSFVILGQPSIIPWASESAKLSMTKLNQNGELDIDFGASGSAVLVSMRNSGYAVKDFEYEQGIFIIRGHSSGEAYPELDQMFFNSQGISCRLATCKYPRQEGIRLNNPTQMSRSPESVCVDTSDGIRCFKRGKFPGTIQEKEVDQDDRGLKIVSHAGYTPCFEVNYRLECEAGFQNLVIPIHPDLFVYSKGELCTVIKGFLECNLKRGHHFKRTIGSAFKIFLVQSWGNYQSSVCVVNSTRNKVECWGDLVDQNALKQLNAELANDVINDVDSRFSNQIVIATQTKAISVVLDKHKIIGMSRNPNGMGPIINTLSKEGVASLAYPESSFGISLKGYIINLFPEDRTYEFQHEKMTYDLPTSKVKSAISWTVGGCAILLDDKVQCWGKIEAADRL